MLIVGEKINTSRKAVKEAVTAKDEAFIRRLARRQHEAGAHYIDVNCGTFVHNEPELLSWLVQVVQDELGGLPLCIDSPNPAAVEAALKVHQGTAMLNSITGEKERYDALEPLVVKYGCKIVVLTMDDESGIPPDAATRFEIAARLIESLAAKGVSYDDIYVDPLIQPISVDSKNGLSAAETIRLVRERFPGVHFICGLSNISFGLPERKLLNQAYMVVCTTYGLDAVILDPEDKRMMALVYATEALLNRDPYCANYLKAYRKGILKE
ncbi:MAG TPA: methyltetrahydrofolate cobalamin methyltransferase [Bacillota bacterium]|jgi:cobalamin-dependent methionine synthase I|nr:methyltetrahydrofolate cobalamin methyltransferase [Bacillota bacterium]HOA35227.1 methyltetrahydrofolate cobalamin methyltransferase [Bacillota bacterium]HOL15663.1 methyltetrahydrofolate cobalamin methyltransferase [Bacillota bacterium]HPZ11485.1 methyltetrahydrofolate cobalamin methyltransferase [Bacillota bacterium]HQE09754.1 methyltetrahydrofolate cobalamin methyltransferase [Bacillota bacterium]